MGILGVRKGMWEALKGEREEGVVIILYFKYKTKIND